MLGLLDKTCAVFNGMYNVGKHVVNELIYRQCKCLLRLSVAMRYKTFSSSRTNLFRNLSNTTGEKFNYVIESEFK